MEGAEMTDTPDTGGPAFPPTSDAAGDLWHGMTLRDWFAGQIAAAMVSRVGSWSARELAETAFKQADAMLAARKEQP
jgi:hypothetical protein